MAAESADPTREGTILALDNVPLGLPVAGVGSRVLAAFLDYVLVSLAMLVWVVASLVVGRTLAPSFGWGLALIILGYFLIEYGYFAGCEIALGGRTAGKRALRLRLRNAVRSVDLLTGVPLMALDPLSRRVGDRLAGTLVVHDRPPEADVVVRRVPAGWGGREVAIVESFFRRRGDLEAGRAEALAHRLLALVERDDPALLQGIAGADAAETLRRALGIEGTGGR